MELDYLYEKYKNTDIILAIYLECTNQDLDNYNCCEMILWEQEKQEEFEKINNYPASKLYNKYLKFLLGNT